MRPWIDQHKNRLLRTDFRAAIEVVSPHHPQ